jgi:hypothetical protein
MSSLNVFLKAVCDLAWIEDQIRLGRKVGLVGIDSQLFMEIIQDPRDDLLRQPMNIWLAVVDESKCHANGEHILQLMWLDNLPKLESIANGLWSWSWYKSKILPNLKIWLYRYDLVDPDAKWQNSLQRGIVYSIKETDKALTTMDRANDTATTSYISLNIDPPTVSKVATLRLSDHLPPETLTLQCHSTLTTSVRLPIQLS